MKEISGNELVVVKSTGGAGLGDLVRTVLSGLHYAQLTDRGIRVSWDDGLYGGVGKNIFPRLFEVTEIRLANKAPLASPAQAVLPQAWAGRLDRPLNKVFAELREDDWDRGWALKHLSFDQTRFDYGQDVLVMWDFDGFHGSWRSADPARRCGSSPEEALKIVAQRHLRPAPDLQEAVDAFRARWFRTEMIGVHVRKTFEKGGPEKQVEDASYRRAIDAIRSSRPDTGLFLATDNAEMEADLKSRYPDLVTRSKWFPSPGEAIHFAKGRPDRLGDARDAVIEMYLLAACDWLVYPALSSFSQVAWLVSGLPQSRAIPLRKREGFRSRWAEVRALWSLGRTAQRVGSVSTKNVPVT